LKDDNKDVGRIINIPVVEYPNGLLWVAERLLQPLGWQKEEDHLSHFPLDMFPAEIMVAEQATLGSRIPW
jgi:hypothetical protein